MHKDGLHALDSASLKVKTKTSCSTVKCLSNISYCRILFHYTLCQIRQSHCKLAGIKTFFLNNFFFGETKSDANEISFISLKYTIAVLMISINRLTPVFVKCILVWLSYFINGIVNGKTTGMWLPPESWLVMFELHKTCTNYAVGQAQYTPP